MTSLLGMHWLREHPDNKRDLAHIEAMQYPSIKLLKNVWDNRDACAGILSVLPKDSLILGRDHALSEQKSDMARDPVGTGTRHANEWALKVAMGEVHLPVERTFFLGINEPNADSGDRNGIDLYTEAFLRRLTVHGLRGGAFNFSTGHPRTVDGTPNTPADYSVFERSHRAIVEGHHLGVTHIYGTAAVPCAPGHYDRLKACPWTDVQWIVGEMGDDEHVIGGGRHTGFHVPFEGHLQDYCGWLDTLIMGIADPRIHSYQVFTWDFSHPWSEFDVSVIHEALESYPWRHMQAHPPTTPDTPPHTIHLPSVGTGAQPKTMYVDVTSGLNLRETPITGAVIAAVPYGEAVTVLDHDENIVWLPVRYEGVTGWMYGPFLSATPPTMQPLPTEPPSQDNWQRTMAFVERWEGEYQNNPADKGNWTGCAEGVGENKGTKYGVSACSYPDLDIKNLRREEARELFRRDYWQPSGAASLPWPACLLVMDTAVLHGVGTAKKWLAESGANPYAFAAKRLYTYTKLDNGDVFWRGWVNRVGDLLLEAAKP